MDQTQEQPNNQKPLVQAVDMQDPEMIGNTQEKLDNANTHTMNHGCHHAKHAKEYCPDFTTSTHSEMENASGQSLT